MSRTQLGINGKVYRFAHTASLEPKGGRAFSIISRYWQPGMPADKKVALWHVDGPQLYSYEQVASGSDEGVLAVEYGDGIDTRWSDMMTLGPAITTLTLTNADTPHPETLLDGNALLDTTTALDGSPNPGNVADIEWTQGGTVDEYYAYFVRDGYVTKVNLATLAVVETKAFMDSALYAIATQTPIGLREVSVALQSSAYQVAYPIASGSGDTWTANTGSQIQRVFGVTPDRIVGESSSSGQLVVNGNILTSVVTMLAPAWATVTTITGTELTPTGFVVDGYRWIIGTTGGPYYIDPFLGTPYALIPEMDINPENGRQMSYWSFLGAIIPSRYGARWQKDAVGQSFGVETFPGNRSTVQGYPTAGAGSTRWFYQAVYNSLTTTTWLLAWHPDSRELRPGVILSPFVIGKFAGNAVCRAMEWVGTSNQARTTQVLLLGNNTNGASMLVGETPQEIDDPAYRYVTAGTAYMTELRRYPHLLKDVEAIEFETANATVNRTITVSMVVAGDAAGSTTITLTGATAGVNDVISTNGYQRRLFVSDAGVPLATATGRRLKPQFAFATNDNSLSAQIIGPIRVYYTLRPIQINEITIQIQLQNDARADAYDKLLELQALENSRPVLIEDDWYGNSYYVRVASVEAPPELLQQGGSPDRPKDGQVFVVSMKLHRWITTSTGITP